MKIKQLNKKMINYYNNKINNNKIKFKLVNKVNHHKIKICKNL